jgi:hypothetical protein
MNDEQEQQQASFGQPSAAEPVNAKVIGLRGAIYCQCGAAYSYSLSGRGALTTSEGIFKLWSELHQGEGHGPASARQAARARRQAESEAWKKP